MFLLYYLLSDMDNCEHFSNFYLLYSMYVYKSGKNSPSGKIKLVALSL